MQWVENSKVRMPDSMLQAKHFINCLILLLLKNINTQAPVAGGNDGYKISKNGFSFWLHSKIKIIKTTRNRHQVPTLQNTPI